MYFTITKTRLILSKRFMTTWHKKEIHRRHISKKKGIQLTSTNIHRIKRITNEQHQHHDDIRS